MKLEVHGFQIIIEKFIGAQVDQYFKSFLHSCTFSLCFNQPTNDRCWCILAPSIEVAEALDQTPNWQGYKLLKGLIVDKICIYYKADTEFPELLGVWEVHDVCV
ncbi:MAG: hypothetical protein WBB28_24920 [Crinalium sp.]